MIIEEFVARLHGVKATSNGYIGLCSAHLDRRNPNLVVTEAEDRILIHCRAGCRTMDVLSAMGLDFPDLFLDNAATKERPYRNGPRQPEQVPRWYWDWRSQCAEFEWLIQEKREHAEGIIAATKGLDVNALTASEFDEVMDHVGRAYGWVERCERLDEMLFDLQQVLRAEEQAMHQRKKTRKMVMV